LLIPDIYGTGEKKTPKNPEADAKDIAQRDEFPEIYKREGSSYKTHCTS
jgi:hypothetical protein